MPRLDRLQRLSLTQFYGAIFEPAAQAFEKIVQRGTPPDFARADLLEAFLWLYLGVELNYFPLQESSEIGCI